MTFTVGPLNATSVATETFTSTAPVPVTSGGTGVTTATGTGAVVLNTNPVLITPTLGNATATSIATQTLTSTVPIPVTSGGTGSSISTGSGGVVLANTPTLTTPNIGVATGQSLVLSGIVSADAPKFTGVIEVGPQNYQNGFVYNQVNDSISLAGNTGGSLGVSGGSAIPGNGVVPKALSWTSSGVQIPGALTAASLALTTPLSTTSGGIGQNSTGTNGQVLISNGTGGSTWGSPSTGSVTSVGISVPSFLSVSGSPITSSGTIAITGASTGTGSIVLNTSPSLTGLISVFDNVNIITHSTTVNGPSISGFGGGQLGYCTDTTNGVTPNAANVTPVIVWSSTSVNINKDLACGNISCGPQLNLQGNEIVTGDVTVNGNFFIGTTDNNGLHYDVTDNGPHLMGAGGGALGTASNGPGTFSPKLVWTNSQVVIDGQFFNTGNTSTFRDVVTQSDLSVTGHFNLNGSELYQTGQWTPTAGEIAAPSTYTRLSSSEQYFYNDWTKIGNVVTVSLSMVFNASAGTSGQGFCIMGLPFPTKTSLTFLPASTNNYTGTSNGILSLGVRPPAANVTLAGGTYHPTGNEVIYYSGLGSSTDAPAGTITSGESGLWIEFTATYLTP